MMRATTLGGLGAVSFVAMCASACASLSPISSLSTHVSITSFQTPSPPTTMSPVTPPSPPVATPSAATACIPLKVAPPPEPPKPTVLDDDDDDAVADNCFEPQKRPELQSLEKPVYPISARISGLQGEVRLRIEIDESGAVTSALVAKGLGPELNETARESAMTAVFTPSTRCGKPVASTKFIVFQFALTD